MVIRPTQVCYSETQDCLYYDGSRNYWCSIPHAQIMSWDKNLRVRVKNGEVWEDQTPPSLVLIDRNRENVNLPGIRNLLAPIPVNIQQLAARYPWNQIAVLRLLKKPGAEELAEHPSALFGILAEAVESSFPDGGDRFQLL